MKFFKKIPIFITIFVFIFGLQFINTKKANAQLVTTDIPQLLKEYGIDTLTTILQNRILDKLINDTINWANNGFEGDPGFINNWDGFLEGVTHDVISTTLKSAQKFANQMQISINNNETSCLEKAEECRIKRLKYINDMEECWNIDDEEEYDLCENTTEVNILPCNMNGISETKEAINEKYLEEKQICNENNGDLYGDIGTIAAENYHSYTNRGVINARSTAETILKYGSAKLNIDPINALIKGEGNTINYLLGGEENVEKFQTEFKYGGWIGYMALADPHNYQAGINSMVEKYLSKKTQTDQSEVNKKITEQQTDNKYKDKKKCIEYSDEEGEDGNKKCLRYETTTTSNVISSTVKESANSDKKRSYLARELSDILARSLGKLTTGLIQVGLNKLNDKFSKNSSGSSNAENMNNIFSNIYQNQYDVLGIADDALIFNIGGNSDENSGEQESGGYGEEYSGEQESDYRTNTGEDASIPYIGGPEDLTGNWNEGPELIVELKDNLEKSIKLTKKYLDITTGIQRKLKSTKDNIAILDYCRPGPDYGWEKRYKDRADFIMNLFKDSKDDKEECADFKFEMKEELFEIGINNLKEMNNDSFLNIPGAIEMTNIIKSVLGNKNKELLQITQNNKIEKTNNYRLLLSIKIEAENNTSFKRARDKIDKRLPLYKSDIYKEIYTYNNKGEEITTIVDKLTDNDLKELLDIKVILNKKDGKLIGLKNKNGIKKASINEKGLILPTNETLQFNNETMENQYLFIYNGLYLEKDDIENNDTYISLSEKIVSTDRKQAENILIDITWDIWRKSVEKEIKSKLRYQYYSMENKNVTEKDILDLKMKLKTSSQNSKRITEGVMDCVAFLNRTYEKSDSEIKTFLENEYNKQQNGESSLFLTEIFTSPENIETSILKFVNSEENINDYYEKMYPFIVSRIDITPIIPNTETNEYSTITAIKPLAKSVNEILDLDKTRRTVQLNMTESTFNNDDINNAVFIQIITADPLLALIGLFKTDNEEFNPNEGKELFCQIKGLVDKDSCVKGSKDYFICESYDGKINEGENEGEKWKAAQRWYFGKKITYEAAFAGI